MASNTFSVGRDCQLVVMGPYGRIDLTHVTGFEARQLTTAIRVDRIDGTQLAAELPKGWDGHFEMERGGPAVDDFISRIEAAYNAGSQVAAGTLYQYVAEADGSVSTYQFDGVVFKLAHAGAWKGDQSVKQKLEFFGSSRRRI
ncbi:MAG: hypothetical protein NT133_15440 [Alphaproteobacteria bacterium]|nr:hypothetical protein [Alphaproteobacteria bacterium]